MAPAKVLSRNARKIRRNGLTGVRLRATDFVVEWTGAAVRAAEGVATTVSENAVAGTVVGTLAASDADSGETFTYSIVGSSSQFEVVGNELRVKSGRDLRFMRLHPNTR